jgi:hypothetical protein
MDTKENNICYFCLNNNDDSSVKICDCKTLVHSKCVLNYILPHNLHGKGSNLKCSICRKYYHAPNFQSEFEVEQIIIKLISLILLMVTKILICINIIMYWTIISLFIDNDWVKIPIVYFIISCIGLDKFMNFTDMMDIIHGKINLYKCIL